MILPEEGTLTLAMPFLNHKMVLKLCNKGLP